MSTLNVSNISDGTDTVETGYVVNGSAKAWVNFDGFSMYTRGSFNTSSMTDLGTGYYAQTFASNFANGDAYSTTTEVADLGWGSKTSCPYQSTSQVRLQAFKGDSLSSAFDGNRAMMTHHGDLA